MDIVTLQAAKAADKNKINKGDLFVNVKDWGAKGNGVQDDTVSINNAMQAAKNSVLGQQLSNPSDSSLLNIRPTVYFPDGVYLVNSQIIIPQGVNLKLLSSSRIKATASIASIFKTDPSLLYQSVKYEGGVLDCNGLSQSGIIIGWAIASDIHIEEIFNPTQHAMIIGDLSQGGTSYELDIKLRRAWRPRSATPTSGYAGINVTSLTDSKIEIGSVRGFDIGSLNAGQNVEFHTVHPWNASGTVGPSICHDEQSGAAGTRLVGYVCDTPSLYGIRIRGNNPITLIGCHFYQNSQGADNTAIAIYADGSPKLTALGCQVYGSGGIRWKNDVIAGVSTTNIRWMSVSDSSTVVTRTWGDRFFLPGFYLNSGSLTAIQAALGSADLVQYFNGSTKVGGINRYGMPFIPSYTTAARPAAGSTNASTSALTLYYDTTLNKLCTCDGTNYRDAMGNIV